MPTSAAKVEDDAASADLAIGHVDKTFNVLRLRVSCEAGEEETDGCAVAVAVDCDRVDVVQPIKALKWERDGCLTPHVLK